MEQLIKLGDPLPEIFVPCVFLDELNSLYNAWKDMFFSS